MQKKKDKLLNKIVKKDYNNELEMILEKKSFDESAKNLLLSILYKIEASYNDYKKIKKNVMSKEKYIQKIIKMIENNCNNITICKMNAEEKNILGKKTFLVEKENKRIICYPIERKLLYCISKISKKDEIIKDDYQIINKTLSDLINIGNNIETVEPLRDFNGYSWTTIPREIESIDYNIIYQNLRILVGQEMLEKWIINDEYIMDYMEILKNKLEEMYGIKNEKEIIDLIKKLSVLLEVKYNPLQKRKLKKQKKEIEEELKKLENREQYIEILTKQKIELAKQIKAIDETINDKKLLQKEYTKRNQKLPLKKKIFSARILSRQMQKERNEKLEEIEKLNNLLNPKKFIKYKIETEQKYELLKMIDTKDIEAEIFNMLINLQKLFLKCYQSKIKTIVEKSEIINCIYEFRYYNLLPITLEKQINEISELKKMINDTIKLLLTKAQELKVIIITSPDKNIDKEILKNIFTIRMIGLEDMYIKLTKEKDKIYLQLFDDEMFEEKVELKNIGNMNKNDLEIKLNKKVKVFT